jgi:ribosomal protein L11 methyltransferase
LDFGTGTGILAILASKAGAGSVLAIDNDDWSIENALENAALNQAGHIDIRKADSLKETGVFDIILGNINLQVILEIIPVLRQHLTPDGVFIGSGVLESDEEKIRQAAGLSGLQMEKRKIRDNWICFSLKNSLSK